MRHALSRTRELTQNSHTRILALSHTFATVILQYRYTLQYRNGIAFLRNGIAFLLCLYADLSPLEGPGFFQTPYDICVASPGGEILVTDLTCGTVQIFDRDGKQIQTIGRGGRSNAEFRVPQGVAVDEEGKVFVGCVYLHCIQMLETTVPDNGDRHQAAAEVVEEPNEDTVLA
jgi:hypothetical protein